MNAPTDSQIIAALEQSGYLFEHEVATKLENLNFHVETSWAFLDSESEKSREIDVRAVRQVFVDEKSKIQVYIELLVECKAFGSPLVFLERQKNAREQVVSVPKEYLLPKSIYMIKVSENTVREVPSFSHLGLRDKHYYLKEPQKATQFAKIVRKDSKWVANHDGVYDSLILPMAKLLEARITDVKKSIKNTDFDIVWLFFPVILLRDHLYSYNLSVENPSIESRGRVTFVRNLESEKLKGFYMTDFVTFANLENYINCEVCEFAAAVAKIIQEQPNLFKKNTSSIVSSLA